MKKLKLHTMLKRLIEDKSISAREVSRSCKIPQATLSAYMAGRGTHRLDHILSLSQYFGVSMEYLLFGEDLRRPTLEELFTENVYEGWLKVKIERAIPDKRKFDESKGDE